jgi:hypothetical protein
MSLEHRLRDSLRQSSSAVDPDVSESLRIVRRKTRRLVIRQRMGQVAFAVIAVGALVVVTPRVVDFIRSLPAQPAHPGPTSSRMPALRDIVGTYTTDVQAGSQVVDDGGLAGRWTMRLEPNGVATMSAPPSFTGVLTGVSFQVSGEQFRIDLFVQDLCSGDTPGAYRWTRSGGELTFTTLGDSCAARVAVLTSGSWTSTG